MARGIPFDFDIPMIAFEKADAPKGQRRRIGGIASLETKDRQDEVLLARGLDFSDFMSNGWFNDNHSKKTTDIVGYPEKHQMFRKGERLPNGEIASAPGHYVEGYLLEDHGPADEIWNLARSLQKTDRRLGFSVEGRVLKRGGFHKSGGKLVAKAKVRNVAITNCPVNTDSKMSVLAKSLQAVEESGDEELMKSLHDRLDNIEKALGMGTATGINPPAGPQTGSGAGQVLTGQSLERKGKPPRVVEEGSTTDEKDAKKKSLSKAEAIAWVRARLPHASEAQARRIVELTQKTKTRREAPHEG